MHGLGAEKSRGRFSGRLALALALCSAALASGQAVVLDRIAVSVGKDVITEGEVLDEIRLTAFLDGEKPDLSAAGRRKAAERMVDQILVRREMQISNYPQPETTEAQKLLDQLKRTRFRGEAPYRQALSEYGITQDQLLDHLLWQLAALRFTDYRLRADIPGPNLATAEKLEEHAHRRASREAGVRHSPPRTDEDESGAKGVPPSVDRQLDTWLKQIRSRTRIVFYKEVFE